MVFSSIIFLFYFLPLFLLAFCLTGFSKNVIVVFSIAFYAWGEPVYVLLLLASIIANYAIGRLIERGHDNRSARLWIIAGVIGNLMPLIWFKYSVFLAGAVGGALGTHPITLPFAPVGLPLGISFYTFHALSYLVDVYRKDMRAERSLRDMIVYVAMFPQLVAGPLIRYKTIAAQVHQPLISVNRAASGIRIFVVGLSQKVLIANTLGASADAIFALPIDQLSTPLSWLGIICYTLQIYFDFGGYSNMAIGLGLVIGFTFPMNFNYPYVARSMTDFWRRWHMSLSSWFRDYVYIPLGGNRVSALRTYVNLTIVFLLCGLWHGAAWTFIAWGAAHGFLLVIERAGLGRVLERSPVVLQHAYVLLCVVVTWVLFRSDTLHHAGYFLAAMFGFSDATPLAPVPERFLGGDVILALLVGSLLAAPWTNLRRNFRLEGAFGLMASPVLELGSMALLMALVSFSLAGGAYNPFIYFRF